MIKHISILFILLLASFEVFAQTASLRCVQVSDTDGTVNLFFTGPSTSSKYEVYRSTEIDGSFFFIGNAAGGTNSNYTDSDVNAASSDYAYLVEAVVGGQGTGPSNIIQTMLLYATNQFNGLVDLEWNDAGFVTNEKYEIWRKKSSGLYQQIGTSETEMYTDTLEECFANYYYQIRLNSHGCNSKSNLRGGPYGDVTAPDQVIPKNATVDTATGKIVLSWFLPSIENADIKKYQIWIMNEDGGTTTFPEAEVNGYNHTSITITNDLVCDSTITFAITAQDSCGNSSVWDEDYFIRTLNMFSPIYNICNDECVIQWDSVYAWNNADVEGIRVYRKEGDKDFEVIADLAGHEQKIYTYGYERGEKYQFYTEAYSRNNTHISTSCIKNIVGKKPTTTSFNWLRSASVLNGEVHLKWQVDSVAYIPYYAISRSSDSINYQLIDTIQGFDDTLHTYVDVSSDYFKSSQHYKIIPFDSCMNMSQESNLAKTIYTTVNSHSDGKAIIEWTPYETMDELEYYHVYRIIDSLIYPFPIGEVYPDEDLNYIDEYSQVVPLLARVGYLVEAVGRFSDSMPLQDTARSNVNFLAKVSNLFVPTGFRPQGGVTQTFKPIYTGVKLINYNFRIMNRWGQIVFQSHQPVLGWDGKFIGEYVAPGPYVYVVEYETIYGKLKRQSGMFMVL